VTQKKSEDGEEFEVGHLGPSDYFGEGFTLHIKW